MYASKSAQVVPTTSIITITGKVKPEAKKSGVNDAAWIGIRRFILVISETKKIPKTPKRSTSARRASLLDSSCVPQKITAKKTKAIKANILVLSVCFIISDYLTSVLRGL